MNRPDEERRFTDWLKRVAADYHRPPATPREALWARVEAGWRAGTAGEGSETTELEGLPLEAADYHRPPPTPREEMWSRIEAGWKLRSRLPAGAREAGLEASVGEPERTAPGERSRGRRAPWAWAVGLAATLVIGIAIGRESVSELERQGASPIASVTEPATQRQPRGEPEREADSEPGAGSAEEGRVAEAGPREAEPAEGGGGPGAAREADPAGTGARSGPPIAGREDADAAGGTNVYRAAAIDHFGRAEAFLTSFRSGEATGEATEAAVASRWARDLLVDTRLLMDWAGDADPRLSILLGELELVLAQIAALPEGVGATERELIVDGMESRDVLPRLRSAIPAGPAGTYLQGV